MDDRGRDGTDHHPRHPRSRRVQGSPRAAGAGAGRWSGRSSSSTSSGRRSLPIGEGMDVRPHPHINLATVTYLFEGAIEHRDSIGSQPGDRAGRDQFDDRGQRASSIPSARPQAERAGRRRGCTGCRPGWRCPTARRRSPRRSIMCRRSALPLVEDGGATARVLMGSLWGASRGDAVPFADDLCRHRARRGRRDADRRRGRRARGDAGRRGGRRSTASRSNLFTLYVLAPGRSAPILSSGTGGRVMLIGGAHFATPRHVFWNFVSSSRERINQAKQRLEGDGASRSSPATRKSSSPSPRSRTTVSYP